MRRPPNPDKVDVFAGSDSEEEEEEDGAVAAEGEERGRKRSLARVGGLPDPLVVHALVRPEVLSPTG